MRDQEQSRFFLGKVGEEWAVFDTVSGNHQCCPCLSVAEDLLGFAEHYVEQGGCMSNPSAWTVEATLTGIPTTPWSH